MKILDALAMWKTTIAHAIACEGINVADGENVCFANTTEEFVEKIIKLFSNDALRRRKGAKGTHLIESNYNFEYIGKK